MSIETQLAIRRNAEELSSYLKDLNSWTSEIKKKDVLAKKTKVKKHNYPPIRSIGTIDSNSPPSSRPSSPVPQEKPTSINKNEVKKERIKSYDYRSWDKYNVEEELERIENEDYKEPKPMVEEKEENDDVNQEAIELSLIEKEKGNIMFKKGNYKRAVQYYTKSKELDPSNPVFPLNRAMAYLKLKKYSEAENDCTDCIALSPKNVKALYRRGLARVGLKKYLEAKSDFEAAVVLDPSNNQAKDELSKVLAILKPKPKEEPKPSKQENDTPTVKKTNQLKKKKSTITKEQEEKLKNKPVRRRLQIIEVGRSQEEIQKEKDEELYKKIEEDINEINELMKSSDMIEDKDKPISITKNNSEESITPLDMMPVSTTKKSDNNKKKPKKMKIIEKEDIEDNKEEEELQQSLKDQNETIKDMENKTTSLPTPSQSETESKKGNEFLNCSNNKSAILSSFILNKEDEKSQEKEKTEEVKDELKPKLNNKRSIIIEEVDKTESIKPVSELPVEKIKEDKSSSIIEIIEKEESPKVQIIEEIKDEENSSSKIQVIEDEKESKKEAVIEVPEENTNIEKPPKKVRPKVNVATTMYDFERDWKSMRNDDQKTFEYLSVSIKHIQLIKILIYY